LSRSFLIEYSYRSYLYPFISLPEHCRIIVNFLSTFSSFFNNLSHQVGKEKFPRELPTSRATKNSNLILESQKFMDDRKHWIRYAPRTLWEDSFPVPDISRRSRFLTNFILADIPRDTSDQSVLSDMSHTPRERNSRCHARAPRPPPPTPTSTASTITSRLSLERHLDRTSRHFRCHWGCVSAIYLTRALSGTG